MIRRHSATAIFMHWYNAACWLLLLFTGFALLANPLMQPVGDWWSSLWTGAFGALGLLRLHVVVGMAWIVLYAAYLLVRARAEALPFLKEITDLHIGSDLVWCLRKGLWLVLGERLMRRLGLDPELPPQGFYNAGQKLVAIIAVLCSLGLALTGLILVFASGRPGTEGLLQICLLAHFCCAGLMAVFLPVHIYMAAFAPGEAPAQQLGLPAARRTGGHGLRRQPGGKLTHRPRVLFDGLCAALLCPERLGECSQRFHGNASQFHMVLPPIESNIFYFTQLRGTI